MKGVRTAGRLIVATLCAGFLAGTAYVAQLGVFGIVTSGLAGALFAVLAFTVAGPAFMIGATLIGPLVWLAVRKTRLNHPFAAILIGAGVTIFAGALLFLGWGGWPGLWLILAFPLAGGVGGWVFQRLMAGPAT